MIAPRRPLGSWSMGSEGSVVYAHLDVVDARAWAERLVAAAVAVRGDVVADIGPDPRRAGVRVVIRVPSDDVFEGGTIHRRRVRAVHMAVSGACDLIDLRRA